MQTVIKHTCEYQRNVQLSPTMRLNNKNVLLNDFGISFNFIIRKIQLHTQHCFAIVCVCDYVLAFRANYIAQCKRNEQGNAIQRNQRLAYGFDASLELPGFKFSAGYL